MNIHPPTVTTFTLLEQSGTSSIANILLNEHGIRNSYLFPSTPESRADDDNGLTYRQRQKHHGVSE